MNDWWIALAAVIAGGIIVPWDPYYFRLRTRLLMWAVGSIAMFFLWRWAFPILEGTL